MNEVVELRKFIKAVAQPRPAINAQRAEKIAVLRQAIDALKIALAGYEAELARLSTFGGNQQ